MEAAAAAIAADHVHDDPAIWITRVPDDAILARARQLEAEGPKDRALWGMPFAVKDNIDIAGLPTTAACPGYAYTPATTAPCVQHLLDAGALLIGKTNLDQFATGLVGTRSPYGVPRNVFDAARVPGGSSSGSACAVAAGIVRFALGTDTAGSGRVPAAFGNIVGLKPTRGAISGQRRELPGWLTGSACDRHHQRVRDPSRITPKHRTAIGIGVKHLTMRSNDEHRRPNDLQDRSQRSLTHTLHGDLLCRKQCRLRAIFLCTKSRPHWMQITARTAGDGTLMRQRDETRVSVHRLCIK